MSFFSDQGSPRHLHVAERDDIIPVDIVCIENGIATCISVKILHLSGVAVTLGGIPFNAFNCTGYLCLDN